MTLEAALLLPFFLIFLMALNMMVQAAVLQYHLHAAVSETVKVMATHLGPTENLYVEAKSKAGQSRPGILFQQVLDRLMEARGQVTGAENAVERFENLIPAPVAALMKWEKEMREKAEAGLGDEADQLIDQTVDPLINKAFKSVVLHYADEKIMKPDKFRIVSVSLPDLGNHDSAFLSIEAEYDYKLPLPFVNKTLHLRDKAFERAWVGN